MKKKKSPFDLGHETDEELAQRMALSGSIYLLVSEVAKRGTPVMQVLSLAYELSVATSTAEFLARQKLTTLEGTSAERVREIQSLTKSCLQLVTQHLALLRKEVVSLGQDPDQEPWKVLFASLVLVRELFEGVSE